MIDASIRRLCILALSLVATPAHSVQPPGPEAFLVLAVNQNMVGYCHARLRPDTVVLRGSLSAETLKAEQAAAQIEEQLGTIRTAVDEAGGTLVPLARTREIDPEAVAALLQQGQGKPFRSTQTIEILLPDETGLDALIDRLLLLGIGAPSQTGGRGSQPQPLVSYRISEPDAQVARLRQDCRRDAVTRWCRQRVSPVNLDACIAALTDFGDYLQADGFSLQPVTPVPGLFAERLVRLGSPHEQRSAEPLDVPSADPVELRGQLTLRLRVPDL